MSPVVMAWFVSPTRSSGVAIHAEQNRMHIEIACRLVMTHLARFVESPEARERSRRVASALFRLRVRQGAARSRNHAGVASLVTLTSHTGQLSVSRGRPVSGRGAGAMASIHLAG